MTKNKKILALILVFCMMFSMLPTVSAFAADKAGGTSIDFTNPADTGKFIIDNQTVSEIREGEGFYMISTREAFENCKGQLSGDAAKSPRDVVQVPVEGDWTATLNLKVDTSGSNGNYEFLCFYGMADYENGVGVRAGNKSTVNFKQVDGTNESSISGMKLSYGLTSGTDHWYKLEKVGTTYTAYASDNGEAYDKVFTYENTGIEAKMIVIDAYSGSSVGYQYWLQSLKIEGSEPAPCEHSYAAVVTAPTCLTSGFTTYTCTQCGDSYVADEVDALGHNYINGKCTRCGELDPAPQEIDPTIPIYENPQYSFAERAADLIARMTPTQKGSQLVSTASAIPASSLGGGTLNVPATKNIDSYEWWSEALHGYSRGNTTNSTSYPQNLTVASTWNPELYYREAVEIGNEIRERASKNSQTGNAKNLNFYSPTVNMHRDPRWGRNEESFSEDVLLTGIMASEFVKGMEGKDRDGNLLDPNGYKKAMCTVKHYTANNSERNRLSGGAVSDLRAIREYYTAPYREVIQRADVSSVMTAYSTLNGEPTSYSSYLMDTLLRQTFGLNGHITSDCDSTATQNRHGYVNPYTGDTMTDLEALSGALAHGEDLECNGGYSGFGTYSSKMTKMLDAAPETDKGIFTENAVDVALLHLMTDRIGTGEFDDNLAYTAAAAARTASQSGSVGWQTLERLAIIDEINNEGVVLLKNNGLLPLQIPAEGEYNVAIVGDWQTNMYLGLYSAGASDKTNQITIQQGIVNAIKAVKADATFTLINSNSLTEENEAAIAAADVAIVVTGTNSNYSKEDGDRSTIKLPNNLDTFISTVGKLNQNTIAIMETCGEMQVKTFEDDVAALLWSSFEGLRKVGFGNVITGAVNPSGKLTDTWYQDVNDSGESDVPSILDYNMYATNGSNGRTYMYYQGEKKPSYVFGYGLSYTTFAYSDLTIDKTAYDANDTVKVSFKVKNTGAVAGKEITQLYIAQPDAPAELLRPIKRLEGFEKIKLQPGETKTVTMDVEIPELAYFDEVDKRYEVDTGLYQIQVGTNSEAAASLTKNFTVSGEMDVYPELLTVKANQKGDEALGIEERVIFDKGAIINPQLTVCMNDESLHGYVIAHQMSPIDQVVSSALPEGMVFTYETNRPSVVSVNDGVIKAEAPGVATVSVTGELDGHVVTADFVVYVESNPLLNGITLNGEPMEDFNREKFAYELDSSAYGGAGTSDETVVMVTASDFQDPATSYAWSDYAKNGDYTAQNATIKGILKNIKATYDDIYAFVAGGDYGFDSNLNATRTQTGVNDVREVITSELGSDIKLTFVQGNHDSAISDFAPSGAYDTEYYGMFTINEDDYASKPTTASESAVKNVADKLSAYLDAKAKAGYDRPVFICTHVPLHFSTRTAYEGDGMYGDTLFHAIQPYGDDLNIIFVFGHDHAWGDDDYLGGASIFLTDGDSINIAKHGSKTEFTTEKLNFTYLNYGYTGYYWSKWANSSSGVRYSNADSALTMTSFAITGNRVVITRWDAEGKHDLKAIGVPSQGNRGVNEVCEITTNTYGSTVTVGEAASANLPIVGYNAPDDSSLEITVEQFSGIPGVASITVTEPASGFTNVYRLGLGNAPVSTDFAEGWEAAQAKLWKVEGGNENAVFGTDGLTIIGEDGMAANLYSEPAYGDWAAQTRLTLAEAFAANNQQAGLLVKDTDSSYVKLVFERTTSSSWWSTSTNYYVTAYRVDGSETTQVARSGNLGAITEVSLRMIKQNGAYTFGYSTDGSSWNDLSGTAKSAMADPKLGVFCGNAAGAVATFDGIQVCKVSQLYPRLASVKLNGSTLSGFDPETFVYNFAVDADAKAPVLEATGADEEVKVEIQQLDTTTGKATIRAYNDAAEAIYEFYFGLAPVSDYFADGDFNSDVWTIERENSATYSEQIGKGLVLPTQSGDIHGTGGAWENCFTAPAQGNWQAVAKIVYPNVPTANYQQAMFLVWQDENNYLRMNCQTSNLGMEPGVETSGSFNGNLGSGQALPAEDGTVTLYFLIDKADNNYTVGYSQDGVNFTMLNTAKNVNFANPRIGLFATQNSSSAQMNMYFEYVAVTWLNGVEQMSKDQMMTWASQNVADYVAAAIPTETKENITFAELPHGYTMEITSSDPNVIAPDGTVHMPEKSKNVRLTVKISDAVSEATAVATVKVGEGEIGCEHSYVAVVTAPTCVADGYTTYTCSKCGESYTDDIVAALGHNYVNGVCTRCGDKQSTSSMEEIVLAAENAAKEAQTAAEAAQAKADDVAAKGEIASEEAAAAQAAAADARNAAKAAQVAAEEAKAAADKFNIEAAESAKQAAQAAANVAAAKLEVAEVQDAVAEALIKAQQSAQDLEEVRLRFEEACKAAEKAAQEAMAVELNAARYNALTQLTLAATADVSSLTSSEINELLLVIADAKNAIKAAKATEEIAAAYEKAYGMIQQFFSPSRVFTDAPARDNWAYEGINFCVSNGIMNGISETIFDPNGKVTRAQLVTILYRIAGEPEVTFKGTFSDVEANKWYSDAIEWAAANGIVNGVGNQKFDPNGKITREQIAVILYRYSNKPAVSGELTEFPDAQSVSDYAKEALVWAISEGLINGINSNGVIVLAPNATASRAQIASIIMRFLDSN